MKPNHTRQGAIVVKFPEELERELAIHAIRMGKKRVSREGREMLVDRTKADAVIDLVSRQLASGADSTGLGPAHEGSPEPAKLGK